MDAISKKYRVVFTRRGSLHKYYFKSYTVAFNYFMDASYKKQAELQELADGAYLTIERSGSDE